MGDALASAVNLGTPGKWSKTPFPAAHLFDDWLRRTYKLGKIVPQRRGMWYSIRRKWATERKRYPVKDVAAGGGWKTEEVLVTSYQQVDAETIKNVVLHPTHRIMKG